MRKNFIRSAVTAVLVTLAAALVFAAAVCLTSCDGSDVDTPPAADGNAYLVIESGEDDKYSVFTLDAGGLGNVFDMLDAADVEYTTSGSGDMRMIVSVGGLSPVGSEYICLYTSVEKDFDVSQYATTLDWCGTTLVSSELGAASMTVEAGCTIYIGLAVYNG